MLLTRVGQAFRIIPRSPSLYLFSTVVKKPKMEMTLRADNKVLYENYSDFYRIVTKSLTGSLIVQNKTPPCSHTLPPGDLKVKFTEVASGPVTHYVHNGGSLVVHPNNTVEIDLRECKEKEQKERESVAGFPGEKL